VVLVVLAFSLLGWMGLGTSFSPASPPSEPVASATAAESSVPVATPLSGSGPATPASMGPPNLAATMAAHAMAAARAAGVKADVVYVPHPSVSAEQLAQVREAGVVSPAFSGDPAPMGLTYYGLSGTGHGNLSASILNTTAVQGRVDFNATGVQGMDLYQSNPDGFSIQLNAVLTDVTLHGTANYSFWTQDVVTYYPASGLMILISNVWNFSGGPFSSSTLYAHGPNGTNDAQTLGFYYSEDDLSFAVRYPFNLTLTMISKLASDGRNQVVFGAAVNSSTLPTEDFSFAFDDVVFNSTSPSDPDGARLPSNYTANGRTYNPVSLLDDFELDICGPGSGSQVDLATADATLSLSYLRSGTFASVPSAYSYGSDTGETSTGANVAWSNVSGGGPAGATDYGTMTTGPSILTGLWGLGAPGGSYAVTLREDPANAFNFFAYNGTAGFSAPIVFQREYAPNLETRTFFLMAGTYVVSTELADHNIVYTVIHLAGPVTYYVNLSANVSRGLYTPLWAFSNAELGALASSGVGSPTSPYVLYNNQLQPFASDFGLYNDFAFPVFPGVFLRDTTASVVLNQPPSFAANTSVVQSIGRALPTTNDLQYWFWNVSNVALLNASNISGWFGEAAYYPLSFDPFSVVFYESSHNLVAGNRFFPEGEGLLTYSGGSKFGPLNIGGGNNTVWGNSFFEIASPTTCPDSPSCEPLTPFGWGLGAEVAEGYDLLYNNLFITPTTAWLLPLNLYSGTSELFTHDLWNITPQAASTEHFAPSFPTIPLSGSIINGTTQGGNSWWDYGLLYNWYNQAVNPLGSLPYVENATTLLPSIPAYSAAPYYNKTYLYPTGDDAPLTSPSETVAISEHGLLPGTSWGAEVTCNPPHGSGGNTSSTACCAPPHGSGGNTSSGTVCCAPPHGSGGNSTSGVCCAPPHGSGGNTSSGCSGTFVLAIIYTTGVTIHLGHLPVGTYNWTPLLPVGYSSTAGGVFTVGNHPISLTAPAQAVPNTSALTVRASGLHRTTPWEIVLRGTSAATDPYNTTLFSTGAIHRFNLRDGAYDYTFGGVPGFTPTPSSGVLVINGSTSLHVAFHRTTYAVTFGESDLANGSRWGVVVSGPIRGTGLEHKREVTVGTTLTFDLPNGSYQYRIQGVDARECPTGNGSSPPPPPYCTNGTFTVGAHPVSIGVTFAPALSPVSLFGERGAVGASARFTVSNPASRGSPRRLASA
jgi:hypothetical protein